METIPFSHSFPLFFSLDKNPSASIIPCTAFMAFNINNNKRTKSLL